jgi:aminoglycoside phosphotransferase (APT) family kinase protein
VNLVEQVLAERYDDLGLARAGLSRGMEVVLLTPRFATSRHVVALVSPAGSPRARVVVKIPRRPGDNGGVRHEADVLQELDRLAAGRVLGVPTVLGTVEVDGRLLLVETALHGTPLVPRWVRRRPALALSAARSFLDALPVVRAPGENDDWYGRLVAEPLAALVGHAPLDGETDRLRSRTHALLGPLRDAALPAVVEHGDLSDPNLMLDRHGFLQAVDWERSTTRGLPGHDLVFFLQHVAECRRSARTPEERLAAFDDAFVEPRGLGRAPLREHLAARDVDPALAGPLVVATWARAAASLVPRLVPEIGARGGAVAHSPSSLADVVSRNRDVALWRHAVARAEQSPALGA